MTTSEGSGLITNARQDVKTEYQAYGSRWLMLALYAFIIIANSAAWVTYAQITTATANFYDTRKTFIDLLSTMFMMVYVPVNVPASWALAKWGLRTGVMIGATATFVGCWIRCAGQGPSTFFLVVIGQTIAAAGQPFMLNAITKLSVSWFPEQERAIATALGAASQLIGTAVGFVVPAAFAPDDSGTPTESTYDMGPADAPEEDDSGIKTANLVMAIMATVPFVLAVVLFKERPPSPPSAAADTVVQELNTWRDIKTMMTDPAFVVLFISFGFGLGSFNTIATLLSQVVEPYGYGSSDSSLFGALTIVFGLIGSGVAGAAMDITKRFKTVLMVWLFIGSGAMVLIWLFLKEGEKTLLCFLCGTAGFFVLPAIPITMELGVELTYPMDEAASSGMLLVSGQIMGTVCIFAFQKLIDEGHEKTVTALVAGMVFISFLISLFVGGFKAPRYKRCEFESAQKEADKDIVDA